MKVAYAENVKPNQDGNLQSPSLWCDKEHSFQAGTGLLLHFHHLSKEDVAGGQFISLWQYDIARF